MKSVSDKDNFIKEKLTILLFVVFICFFGVGYVIFDQREFSELENRNLSTLPSFDIKKVIDGEFTAEFESYASDQIFLKDVFVRSQVMSRRLMGQKLQNGVYDAKQGFQIQVFTEPSQQYEDNLQYLHQFALENPDLDLTLVLAPNADEIYEDKLPGKDLNYDQTIVMDRAKEVLGEEYRIVDTTDRLMEHKGEEVYFHTDHHWNFRGAYYGYEEICEALNLTATPKQDFELRTLEEPFYGSLYSKLPLASQFPDEFSFYWHPEKSYIVDYPEEGRVEHSLYDETYVTKKDKYALYFGGNYPLVTIREPGAEPKQMDKVLIIKDSYANSVVPLLCDQVDEIHMMDLRYFHGDVRAYIDEHEIHRVIFIHNVDFLTTDQNFLWL